MGIRQYFFQMGNDPLVCAEFGLHLLLHADIFFTGAEEFQLFLLNKNTSHGRHVLWTSPACRKGSGNCQQQLSKA